MLADLGADVAYVEPPEGDRLRLVPPFVAGCSTSFAFLSAGKRAVATPLPGEFDAAIMDARSFATTDKKPAATAVLSMTADGDAQPASEFTVMALSGVLDIVGAPDREPLKLAGHQAAYSAGLAAFAGLLSALCLARAGGGCETIRVNLLDTLLWINWKSVIASQGGRAGLSRQGSAAEWQVIRCADGWLALVHQENDWPALRALADQPALDDARFATLAGRRANAQALAAVIEAGLMRHTRAEIRALALARRLPLGPVWSLAELLHDRHYLERGVFFPAALPGGEAPMASLPVVWNGARFAPGPVPSHEVSSHA